MKIFTSTLFVMFALLMTDCKSVWSIDTVKTSKGFYRFYKTTDDIHNSKAEFCAVDAKTSAITCKDVTINFGF
ncbi:hypothetical protein [Leptospira weilii]|uniref:hypothetical protein n=1 Tax=Leptospira weilii TaxID=28184 RepID=UPI00055CE4CF|nr:hypothetical protein [Leptospira weilii]